MKLQEQNKNSNAMDIITRYSSIGPGRLIRYNKGDYIDGYILVPTPKIIEYKRGILDKYPASFYCFETNNSEKFNQFLKSERVTTGILKKEASIAGLEEDTTLRYLEDPNKAVTDRIIADYIAGKYADIRPTAVMADSFPHSKLSNFLISESETTTFYQKGGISDYLLKLREELYYLQLIESCAYSRLPESEPLLTDQFALFEAQYESTIGFEKLNHLADAGAVNGEKLLNEVEHETRVLSLYNVKGIRY